MREPVDFSKKELLEKCISETSKIVKGQDDLIKGIVASLVCEGHLLIEGLPGLGKTLSVVTLSKICQLNFNRVQFTPDLLPSDLIGTLVYNQSSGEFSTKFGPIFTQILLTDEINRSPPKVQSSLLEAMAERQVTIGDESYKLSSPFVVLATQNPLEQEGTYPLPEAQLDRFMMHVNVDYPNSESEHKILELVENEARQQSQKPVFTAMSQDDLFAARDAVLSLHMAESIKTYIVELVMATREPKRYADSLDSCISVGVSPRATIALSRCARSHAWLSGKTFVSPDDVQAVIHDVFRHRLILDFEAEAQGITPDDVIDQILNFVPAT